MAGSSPAMMMPKDTLRISHVMAGLAPAIDIVPFGSPPSLKLRISGEPGIHPGTALFPGRFITVVDLYNGLTALPAHRGCPCCGN
jgi:hypothetical protein